VLATLLSSCGGRDASQADEERPRPPSAESTASSPEGSPPSTGASTEPSEALSRCRRHIDELRGVLADLPSACSTDTDCVCYSGGISGLTGCGGVSDSDAASSIRALSEAIEDASGAMDAGEQCFSRVSCAPRRCVARCVEGRCVDES